MRPFLTAFLLVLCPEAAWAADWRVVLTDEEEDWGRMVAFVDASSLQRNASRVVVNVDFRLQRPPNDADGVRSRLEGDCDSFDYQSFDQFYYSGEQRLRPTAEDPLIRAEPGTNMYVLLGNVCAGTFLSGSVDPIEHSRAYFSQE